jgi:hypothetical protein
MTPSCIFLDLNVENIMARETHTDGWEDHRRGRSNRAAGQDDNSSLGRGHGFGPQASRGLRPGARPGANQDPRRADDGHDRNYGRLADDGSLEEDRYTRGQMNANMGSRSRSLESRRRRPPTRDRFDDDLK